MLTNILATVVITLVTNVTNWDNHKGCEYYAQMHPEPDANGIIYSLGISHFHQGCSPYVAATERYVKSDVVERTVWTFHCPDKDRPVSEDKLLSSVTETYRLKSEWSGPERSTNDVRWSAFVGTNEVWRVGHWMTLTNITLTNYWPITDTNKVWYVPTDGTTITNGWMTNAWDPARTNRPPR